MKIIPTVSELLESLKNENRDYTPITLSNIDDFFGEIASKGITDVLVNRAQMHMIAMFMIANCNTIHKINDKYISDYNLKAWKILTDGKVKKFLGIKLHLTK